MFYNYKQLTALGKEVRSSDMDIHKYNGTKHLKTIIIALYPLVCWGLSRKAVSNFFQKEQ